MDTCSAISLVNVQSTHFAGDSLRQREIPFSVNLCDVRPCVAHCDLRRFQPEPLANLGCVGVPESVRV